MNKQIIDIEKKIRQKKETLDRLSHRFSNIRLGELIFFILFLILALTIPSAKIVFYILLILDVIGFLVTVCIHLTYIHQEKSCQKKLDLIKFYERKTTDEWKKDENRFDFVIDEDLERDLNLNGKNSLFQYISVCRSKDAKKELLTLLDSPGLNQEEIEERQSIVEELTNHVAFILDFLNFYSSKKEYSFEEITKKKNIHFSSSYLFFNIAFSLIIFLFFILAICKVIPYFIFPILMAFQLAYTFYALIRNQELFHIVSDYTKTIRDLKDIFDFLLTQHFTQKELEKKMNGFQKVNRFIRQFTHISYLDTFRYNAILFLITNSFFPFITLTGYLFNKEYQTHAEEINQSILDIQHLEVYISLATIGLVKETSCMPQILSSKEMKIENIKHPLLLEKTCISNSFENKEPLIVITGSNMSGKSSFLRSIAINLTLMQAGSRVNATSFQAPLLKIFTSISVKDDISHGISSFHAELLRIKKVLDYTNLHQEPFIVFIDEIFKGTNYQDRLFGAESIIELLLKQNCFTFITTHDMELTQFDSRIKNYHFEEKYEGDNMIFSYQILEGPSKSRNARYLMKKIGLLKEEE